MTMYDDRTFKPTIGGQHEWVALSTAFERGGKNRNSRTETIRGLYLADLDEERKIFAQVESESMSKKAAIVREKLKGLLTVNEFADEIRMHPASAKRYLDAATAEGITVCHKGSAANQPDRFELSESAKRSLELNLAYLAQVNEEYKQERGLHV